MRILKILILLTVIFNLSCTSCSSDKTETDSDIVDEDVINTENEKEADEEEADTDNNVDEDIASDNEEDDTDMYCPLTMNAKYPYFREDGTIHFCRPCDMPDEYDPQCVKSLWKDLNKEVYDKYKAGAFEESEYLKECYPWPCNWDVVPTPRELMPKSVHECDIFLNPYTWANSFTGSRKESNLDNGKIVFWTMNYRIGDKTPIETEPGYAGQRVAMYDIETGKYTTLGFLNNPGYMNGVILANPFASNAEHTRGYWAIVAVVPYKDSFKYEIVYGEKERDSMIDTASYMTDKWTVMVVNHLDKGDNPVSEGNRSLMYAKTGEWNWITLAYGNPEGKAGEISIMGDKAMFYHYGTNATWLCDLSKSPQKVEECTKVGREGEQAGFPKFDRENGDRIIYRSVTENGPTNKFVIMDISKTPWEVVKEFEIPYTETNYINMWIMELRSNVMLYMENYQLPLSGYQEDGKLCFYRIDKGKTYCSKPVEGQSSYGHGYAEFEGKYLFWQPMYKTGYILRDMECYCEKEGVCPFEE